MAERKEIELIPKEVALARREERRLFTFRVAGFAFLGLTLVVLAILLSLIGGQTLLLNNLQRQVSTKEERIADLVEIEKKVTGLANKNNTLTQVFNTRSYYSVLLAAIKKSIPQGVVVTHLSTDQTTPMVNTSGTIRSYSELALFLKNLVDPTKGGSLFTEAGIQSVILDPTTGKAKFTVDITIAAGGLRKSLDDLLK